MDLQLFKRQRLGLEIWTIELNGRELHTFLSERHARTRFERVRLAMGFSIARKVG